MKPTFFALTLIGLVLFSITSCTEDPPEPNQDPRFGFKFVDDQEIPVYLDYQSYLENKPDSFYDKPYLINHEGSRVSLETRVVAFSRNPGLSFYYQMDFSILDKYYSQGIENVPRSFIWTVHFSEERVDTIQFGFSKELAESLNCNLDAYPAYQWRPGESFINWKFLVYKNDTILSGCLDNPIRQNLNLLDANSNELLIPLIK